MDLLGLVLHGVPVLVLIACIVWIVRFNISPAERGTIGSQMARHGPGQKNCSRSNICLDLFEPLPIGRKRARQSQCTGSTAELNLLFVRAYSGVGISLFYSGVDSPAFNQVPQTPSCCLTFVFSTVNSVVKYRLIVLVHLFSRACRCRGRDIYREPDETLRHARGS